MAFSLTKFSTDLKVNQRPFVGGVVKLSTATNQAIVVMAGCDHKNTVGAPVNPANRSLCQSVLQKTSVKTQTGYFSGKIQSICSVQNTLSN